MTKPTLIALALAAYAASAGAQTCPNRGELDTPYCDANNDLVADASARPLAPKPLVLGIGHVEDMATAYRIYAPLTNHLSACLKQEVMLNPVVGEGKVLEAMRGNKVHVAQFSTGVMSYAVNFAGAVPFAAKGMEARKRSDAYTLMLIVPANSSYRKPADLRGKRIAHTSESSNSGNLAPRVLFPELGLVPEKDYRVEFSGKHENSIRGVAFGLYDGAAVASDFFERMIAKGEVKRDQFRVLYESDAFPTEAFAYSNNLEPQLAQNLKGCFENFKFPETMSRQLEGNNRFFPVNYNRDWRLVRTIAKAAGNRIDRAGYDKLVSGKK